jgi:hypothetical protein
MKLDTTFTPSTVIPNEILDEWLTDLTGAELKVVLCVARATDGFKEGARAPRVPEIARATCLKKTAVRRALRFLILNAKGRLPFGDERGALRLTSTRRS